VTARDGNARLELPVTADRADLLFQAAPAAGTPLTLEWRGGPRMVGLSSWTADGRNDLRLDLRRAGAGPATLRVFDGDRPVAEAPVPTGVEVPLGSSSREPTSVHIYVTEDGDKIVVFDYDLAPGGGTSLSSPVLGLQRAPVTHVAVALPPATPGADHRAQAPHPDEVLAVGGAREITVFEARTP
jgi:hypothetical protein